MFLSELATRWRFHNRYMFKRFRCAAVSISSNKKINQLLLWSSYRQHHYVAALSHWQNGCWQMLKGPFPSLPSLPFNWNIHFIVVFGTLLQFPILCFSSFKFVLFFQLSKYECCVPVLFSCVKKLSCSRSVGVNKQRIPCSYSIPAASRKLPDASWSNNFSQIPPLACVLLAWLEWSRELSATGIWKLTCVLVSRWTGTGSSRSRACRRAPRWRRSGGGCFETRGGGRGIKKREKG